MYFHMISVWLRATLTSTIMFAIYDEQVRSIGIVERKVYCQLLKEMRVRKLRPIVKVGWTNDLSFLKLTMFEKSYCIKSSFSF